MKKYIVTLACCLSAFAGLSQVSIQPLVPLSGLVQKTNLWNIAVISTAGEAVEAKVELSLRDRTNGAEVLTAVTASFRLNTGATQLNASYLAPLQYNLLSADISARSDDFIPVGNYNACYRVTANKNIVAEECVSFDVEPLSPPMLITPADSTVFNTQPAQFSWIPPSPLNLFSRLQYEAVFTEILPGQKATEAIQQNLPFYSESFLTSNVLPYAGRGPLFEKDKWYAWQVVAGDANAYAAKSEVWVFRVADEVLNNDEAGAYYIVLNENGNNALQVTDRVLRFKYSSNEEPYHTEVTFIDVKNQKVFSSGKDVKQGENYFEIPLNKEFKDGQVYTLSLINKKGKNYTITFSLKTK